jgi:hypothetical protein
LIVAVNDEVSEIEIYKGDGMGTFTLYSTIPTPFQPLGIALADFDNNGVQDLVVSVDNLNENNILLYQGNGTGLFIESMQLSTAGFPSQLFAEDCNKDGLPDILVNDLRVSVFLNNQIINGTKAVAATGHFSISPNPANTDVLNIQLKNTSTANSNILIINNIGKTVYQQKHRSLENITVPLTDFDSGIYWVTIENETFVASEKLVISR